MDQLVVESGQAPYSNSFARNALTTLMEKFTTTIFINPGSMWIAFYALMFIIFSARPQVAECLT